VCRPFHFEHGVADSDRKAYAAHHRQIRQIVADESDSRFRDSCFYEYFFQRGNFRGLLLIDEFHLHFVGAAEEGGAFTTRNATGAQSCGMRESQTLAVMGVERFDFESGAVGLRKKRDGAVGHGAVHIHEEDLDLCGAFL
jgi:hypothetical protein